MPTLAEIHLGRVAALGCWICGKAAHCHHIRDGQGMGRKASDFETIPLCPIHHQTGGYGVAFHAGPEIWEKTFGRQRDILAAVQAQFIVMYGEVATFAPNQNDKADRIRKKNAKYSKLKRI